MIDERWYVAKRTNKEGEFQDCIVLDGGTGDSLFWSDTTAVRDALAAQAPAMAQLLAKIREWDDNQGDMNSGLPRELRALLDRLVNF